MRLELMTSPGVADYLKHHIRDYGMLVALVVIMAFFQIWTDGVLLKPLNLTNLFLQNSYIIIMALGMLLDCLGEPRLGAEPEWKDSIALRGFRSLQVTAEVRLPPS